MANDQSLPKKFVFPRWVNYLLPLIVVSAVGGGAFAPVVVGLGFSANTLNVGYAPEQPIPYSHALHVGELGLDCRYCHTTVDDASFAAIPPTETCMNCHATVKTDSARLAPLYESYETGKPIEWVKVHDLPDYVYFNHSAHVNKGVSCVSCHGRVDKMEVVYQAQPLSMAWCLGLPPRAGEAPASCGRGDRPGVDADPPAQRDPRAGAVAYRGTPQVAADDR